MPLEVTPAGLTVERIAKICISACNTDSLIVLKKDRKFIFAVSQDYYFLFDQPRPYSVDCLFQVLNILHGKACPEGGVHILYWFHVGNHF